MNHSDEEAVALHCASNLDMAALALSDEYYYTGLPLCVIDAVYSIGVKYESTANTVRRYCDHFSLPRLRPRAAELPPIEDQESVEEFRTKMLHYGIERLTTDVFANRQRTSSCNGILKAEAVYRFADALTRHGVNYLQDVVEAATDAELEAEIRSIPGQKSGISFQYFLMLAGSDDLIKPDRMILRFLSGVLGRVVAVDEAQALVQGACLCLRERYPHLTPRLLDYAIWEYQREQGS